MSGTHPLAGFVVGHRGGSSPKGRGAFFFALAGLAALLFAAPAMAQTVTASANPMSGNAPLQVAFVATTSGLTPPLTWAWAFGDGGSATAQNVTHSYSVPGSYYAQVSVTDSNAVTATATVGPIQVYIPVTVQADVTCGEAYLNVCFSAGITSPNPPFSYEWNFGDGTFPTPNYNDPLPCHTFTTANTYYTVTVNVHDAAGAVGHGAVVISTTPLTAVPCVTPVNGNAPLLVQFNDGCGFVSGGMPPYSYVWDFGDGSELCYDWKTQHGYNDPGTYHVTLRVTDSCAPPTVVVDRHLIITVTQANVVGTATVDRTCGPNPLTACFAGSAIGGTPPYSYSWDFGDGSPAVFGPTPCHTYSATGTYTVTMTVTDAAAGTSTDNHIVISVTDPMTATAMVSRADGFAPFSVFFTSSVQGGTSPFTYRWDFGDGSTSTLVNPNHVYTQPGYYQVKLTVKDGCIPAATSTDDHLYIIVYPVQATASANFTCGTAPLNVILTGSAVGGEPPYTWSWSFGDGTPGSTLQNPSHSYLAVGTYTATVTATDALGVSGSSSVTIGVTPALQGQAMASVTSGPAPLTVDFSSSVSGGTPPYTYDWDFGDGSQHSTSPADQHTMIAPGLYSVVLTIADSCGHSVQSTLEINAYGDVQASVAANPTCGIAPLNVIFTGSASGGVPPYTYSWNFGDGSPADAQQNPSHSYLSAGIYNAVLTVHDSAAHVATASVAVSATVPLQATAAASVLKGRAPLLVNFTSTVSGGSPPYTYRWDFGDGSQSVTSPSAQHTLVGPGTYTVTLTVNDSCGNQVTSGLTVEAYASVVPAASASVACGVAPLNVCFTSSATGGVPPYTWSWNFGDGSPASADARPCHYYTSPGTYTVTLTATDSVGNVGMDSATEIRVVAATNLTVTAQADQTQGLPPLTVHFSKAVSGSVGPFTYDWDFGDGSNHDTGSAPTHIYLSAGTYTVTLTVTTQDACGTTYTKTDSHLVITVYAAPTIRLLQPTAGGMYGSSVTFQSSVMDDAAVLYVAYTANGLTVGTATAAPYTFVWNTTGMNGAYSVAATVYDALGRSASSSPITISIGNPTLDRVVISGSPFKLLVFGSGFQVGAVVKINGVPAPISQVKSSTLVVAKGGGALKAMLPKGSSVLVTVQNPDGSSTAPLACIR
jgi:PKD repeat protein